MSHYFINDNNLKHNKKIININYNNKEIKLYTDNGVFSKEHFDYGSKLLVNNFLKEEKSGRVLDLGCGYGVIGIILSQNKKLYIDMVDINNNAVNLTNENLKLNNIENATSFVSNILPPTMLVAVPCCGMVATLPSAPTSCCGMVAILSPPSAF